MMFHTAWLWYATVNLLRLMVVPPTPITLGEAAG
jgi:hypothetical protein